VISYRGAAALQEKPRRSSWFGAGQTRDPNFSRSAAWPLGGGPNRSIMMPVPARDRGDHNQPLPLRSMVRKVRSRASSGSPTQTTDPRSTQDSVLRKVRRSLENQCKPASLTIVPAASYASGLPSAARQRRHVPPRPDGYTSRPGSTIHGGIDVCSRVHPNGTSGILIVPPGIDLSA
jgi:hypothetical protein